MLNNILKFFSGKEPSKEDSQDRVYFDYDGESVNKYRELSDGISFEEIVIPNMSPNNPIDYSVTQWYKKDRERIKAGDILCELETGKALMELESYEDGYLYFRRRPKQKMQYGDILCFILSKNLDES